MTLSVRKISPFFGVLALAAVLRLWNLDLPFIEPYNSLSRQAIVAGVARNFYQHGFNFFYPEIDENGPGPYLYNAEMPFYSYLMALGYALVGGPKEWVARLVSVLFSLGAIVLLGDLVRRVYGSGAALWTMGLLAVSPLYLALSRSIQPESCMIFASAGAVWAFFLYMTSDRRRDLALASAFLFLAVATKIYNLYLVIPLLYLAWRREGTRLFRNPRYYAALAFAVLPLVWYAWMWWRGQTEMLLYDPYDFTKTRGPAGKAYFELFAPAYLGWSFKILAGHLLAPFGAVLVLGVCLERPMRGENKVFYAWLAGVVFLMLVMWRTVLDHAYYLLPFVLPLAGLAGKGALVLGRALCSGRQARALFLAAVFVPALLAQVWVIRRLYPGIYHIPKEILEIVSAGEETRRRTSPDDLVIASYGTSNCLLYYCARKGWAFYVGGADGGSLIRQIEELRAAGADWFVTSRSDQLREAPTLDNYLRTRYRVVYEHKNTFLVRLSKDSV